MSAHVRLPILASIVTVILVAGCSVASPASSLPASGPESEAATPTPTMAPTQRPPPTPPPIPEPTPQAEVDAFLAQCAGVPPAGEPVTLEITAQGTRFDLDRLSGPIHCQPFAIVFHNLAWGHLHNVAILLPGNSGPYVFWEPAFEGSQTVTYEVPALPAGDYTFICEVHPLRMRGTLQVAAG